jgi:hypothetical protein
MITITKESVCNLARLPTSIRRNPCHLTVRQILDDNEISLEDTALYKHYKEFSAKTLSDLYNVQSSKLEKFSYDAIFLPWIHYSPVTLHSDKAFMSAATNKFIKDQVEKLRSLIRSFKRLGYSPESFSDRKMGHVTGYCLQNQDKHRCYIVSGNHRVATMFGLFPVSKMPMMEERVSFMKPRDLEQNGVISGRSFPTVFDAKDVDKWPSVTSGFITSSAALEIFERYINS